MDTEICWTCGAGLSTGVSRCEACDTPTSLVERDATFRLLLVAATLVSVMMTVALIFQALAGFAL
jgi:hypothetical protein